MAFFSSKPKRIIPDMRESFTLPYRGGEILSLLLDNLEDNMELISERMSRNEKLCARPSSPSLVLYELHDTKVTYEVAGMLVDSLMRLENKITKLALGGVSGEGKRNIRKYLRKSGMQFPFPVKHFYGLEPAKEWLIEKRS